ncbi:hypothetical protein NLM59_01915 [Weeksellaceae bacterium KMM 9724]|uniref:hypothetical protein n=1 Tax=Profundicola chukchiensis TaxID=2961959 RepID=UPI002440D67B|nr:hypothetical protein [Profundicola chukchiensis]MDG4949668.1 hypothetical protein [Profundicola chukchiensis]
MDIERLKEEKVQDWLEAHKHENVHDLAFKKPPFEEILMKDLLQQIQGRNIVKKKIPLLEQKGILFPPKLNLEQTSSEATAVHKASIVEGKSVIDITGGLGIDCIAFASSFEQVYHLEQNKELQAIAASNFKQLGLENITSIATDGIDYLKNTNEVWDVLYVDPSRRDDSKNRVFLLEDMTPNLLEHLELISSKAKLVLIKLSPLIDLSYLLQTLDGISEIQVVALKNEVKEIMVKIEEANSSTTKITAVNLESDQAHFEFKSDEIDNASCPLGEIGKYLYEPSAAIQKSGGNEVLGIKFNLKKLHPNTQLFTSDELHENYPGRVFEILEKVKSPKKELKNLSIMAIHRNFPDNLVSLRKKYKFTTDGLKPVLFARNLDQIIIHRMKFVKF